jgi:hypothetical protein
MKEKEKKEFLKDLGSRVQKLLPDEKTKGDPFWGLMEKKDGKITGSYYMLQELEGQTIPLFFAKEQAETFLSKRTEDDLKKYVVRGFTKEMLLMLSNFSGKDKFSFMVFEKTQEGKARWAYKQHNGISLALNYLR